MSNARPLLPAVRAKNYVQQSPSRRYLTDAQHRACRRGRKNREAFLRKEGERVAQAFQKLDAATASTDSQEN